MCSVVKDKIGDVSIKLQFGSDETWTRALRHVSVCDDTRVSSFCADVGGCIGSARPQDLTGSGFSVISVSESLLSCRCSALYRLVYL